MLLNDMTISRRVYSSVYADHLGGDGLSIDPMTFNINIEQSCLFSMSDLGGIVNFFDNIIPIIKSKVEDNFRGEVIIYKKKLILQEILSKYRSSVDENTIRDVFAHVIDILGEPKITLDKDLYLLSFRGKSLGDKHLKIDNKMTDFFYELAESTTRLKSCYEKISIGISIGDIITISISPEY